MTDDASLLEVLDRALGGERRDYDPGDLVFGQGDPVTHLHAVESGQVRPERSTVEGRRVLMYVAGAGESFAEAALLHGTFHCNAVAAEASRIVVFHRDSVLDLLRGDPDRAEQVILLLASQVRDLRARLELRNILSAGDRILHYLLLAAEEGVVPLRTPLKDVAAELGLARETFYRELGGLEKAGLIRRTDGEIHILSGG